MVQAVDFSSAVYDSSCTASDYVSTTSKIDRSKYLVSSRVHELLTKMSDNYLKENGLKNPTHTVYSYHKY